MVSRVRTVAFQGIEVLDIDVQVQILGGVPNFNLVGLPDKAVGESRERVRSALYALGLAIIGCVYAYRWTREWWENARDRPGGPDHRP